MNDVFPIILAVAVRYVVSLLSVRESTMNVLVLVFHCCDGQEAQFSTPTVKLTSLFCEAEQHVVC